MEATENVEHINGLVTYILNESYWIRCENRMQWGQITSKHKLWDLVPWVKVVMGEVVRNGEISG